MFLCDDYFTELKQTLANQQGVENYEIIQRRRPAPLAPGPAHHHRGLALQ